jgi:hypothetical protein
MHRIPLVLLLVCVGPLPTSRVQAGEHNHAAIPAPAATGKERLSDKASDEQRVDDCKVPASRRTPTSCDLQTQ